MRFKDLAFSDLEDFRGGIKARVFFRNGYGASVVRHSFSYGGSEGLYELAVLKGKEGKSVLCYDTPVTSDVEGHLTPRKVTGLLKRIEALPKAPRAKRKASRAPARGRRKSK